jgi:hypothetical protein
MSSELPVASGESPLSAFERFLSGGFSQKIISIARSPLPKETDYATLLTNIVLPPLDPPKGIRERRMRPASEIQALLASLSCPSDTPDCGLHLMVPFYGDADPSVPVYRQCLKCYDPHAMIIFMNWVDGHWWHGGTNFDESPDFVSRASGQIEKALMVEVRR